MAATRPRRGQAAASNPVSVPGFRVAGVRCGVKAEGLDLALIASDGPASAAGVFTRSTVVGAPVELCRRHLKGGRARAVVVNSGISNVAMGERGRRDALDMAERTGQVLDVPTRQVFVASTGVIGEPLPMTKLRRGIASAGSALRGDGWDAAARAIMTTDTFPKTAMAEVRVNGKPVRVAGIAKGSGMIEPDMATMLAFLVTDAAADSAFLQAVLSEACGESFNRVTVDGETSTSDSVLLLAGGAAGNPPLERAASRGAGRFSEAVHEVATSLARDLARDGEGATRLVTVQVSGARSGAEAERAARRVANSMLVKTAIFGGDPNWGRILQTVGAAQVAIRLERARVTLGGVTVFRHGASAGAAARRRAALRLEQPEVEIGVELGAGKGRARIWTCDLSYDYVKINAEYTT